jgi:uncharacterized damage-inducible protein DinB
MNSYALLSFRDHRSDFSEGREFQSLRAAMPRGKMKRSKASSPPALPGEYKRGDALAQRSPAKRRNIMAKTSLTHPVCAQAVHVLKEVHLPRIVSCLEKLSGEQIWWRPNDVSNSVGNLVLHLTGNVRQWIISGLGGAADVRQREREFSERRPLPRRVLVRRLRKTVEEACRVLSKLSPEDLARVHSIQKYQVRGMGAAFHVAEHFSHHAGQIILLTKMLTGRDLKFTQLPGEKRKTSRNLPAW